MGEQSKIQWTDTTWNPVTGFTHVSEGCRNCYAERIVPRQGHAFKDVTLHPDRLDWPLKWRKPRRIFVNSLSDMFHEDVPNHFILDIWNIMNRCPQHTFQILTKRHERMRSFLGKGFMGLGTPNSYLPSPNVWLGVSIESREHMNRADVLRQTPAAVRFLSLEPLLEDLGKIDLSGIDWVIIGGESGPKARPCDFSWIQSIRDQCQMSGVACFIKQLGAKPTGTGKPWCDQHGFEDRKGGNPAEWPENFRVREYPSMDR